MQLLLFLLFLRVSAIQTNMRGTSFVDGTHPNLARAKLTGGRYGRLHDVEPQEGLEPLLLCVTQMNM